MTTYLASYLPAIQSIIPQSSPTSAPLPEIGSKAPSLPDVQIDGPTLVAFVRHCGCPFAEKEIHLLSDQLKAHPQLKIIIVQHAEKDQVDQWFNEIGGPRLFLDTSRYTLIPDPSRQLYANWGIGQLGWGGMINKSIMDSVSSLEKEGINLRSTGKGSYRWQNSGGFAVDQNGFVKWRKIALDSSDICDYSQAANSLL
ncbi:uncharacterized protein IL334_000761 [Kwoniella shivajii]|uniref:Alkyl hydroperoxide reductase subunit C/ Thiol specific antioxidant domain-containing protein n=1 Tax=Kwoniella shivajii TaxID=564305 RepID=A0ABZ1CQ21_9TREE|nr:hypothetical protein IL334_000761 [Kwoniella shivajii]